MIDTISVKSHFQEPIILISKCLEFSACRYDGNIILNKYIHALKSYVKFIPICPEVEIGLGIPRDPIHIIQKNIQQILYQATSQNDLTNKMEKFSEKYLNKLKDVDGFILKSKSPSCGLNTTKIFSDKEQSIITGKGSGMFASKLIDKFTYHPKVEDVDLENKNLREHFITSVFTLCQFRKVKSIEDLFQFHDLNKYLFTTYNQRTWNKMNEIVLCVEEKRKSSVLIDYSFQLLKLFEKLPNTLSHINTQENMFNYIKNDLTPKEKKQFIKQLNEFRSNSISLSSIKNTLIDWAVHYNNEYLLSQSYFNPFPAELMDIK